MDVAVKAALDGIGTIVDFGDDLQVRLVVEQVPETAADHGVVVGYEDLDWERYGHLRSPRRCQPRPSERWRRSRAGIRC